MTNKNVLFVVGLIIAAITFTIAGMIQNVSAEWGTFVGGYGDKQCSPDSANLLLTSIGSYSGFRFVQTQIIPNLPDLPGIDRDIFFGGQSEGCFPCCFCCEGPGTCCDECRNRVAQLTLGGNP